MLSVGHHVWQIVLNIIASATSSTQTPTPCGTLDCACERCCVVGAHALDRVARVGGTGARHSASSATIQDQRASSCVAHAPRWPECASPASCNKYVVGWAFSCIMCVGGMLAVFDDFFVQADACVCRVDALVRPLLTQLLILPLVTEVGSYSSHRMSSLRVAHACLHFFECVPIVILCVAPASFACVTAPMAYSAVYWQPHRAHCVQSQSCVCMAPGPPMGSLALW